MRSTQTSSFCFLGPKQPHPILYYNHFHPIYPITFAPLNSNMDHSDPAAISKLIQKVASPIPEIQTRSIASIFTKLEHQLILPHSLVAFPEFPGLLMTWINDNKHRSDSLYKVISILAHYTEVEEGLLLLRQYEALQFCEEFRQYLFVNERNVDGFLKKLDAIIQKLIPLGRSDALPPRNIHQQQPEAQQQPVSKKPEPKEKSNPVLVITISVYNKALDEKVQKQIFDLLVSLKYAHKETLYTTLCSLRSLLARYSKHSFRCKMDLLGELMQIALQGIFPQICCEGMQLILFGLRACCHSCQSARHETISLNDSKVSLPPSADHQIHIDSKLWSLSESFVLVEQIILFYQLRLISLEQLLSVTYSANPWYYARILSMQSPKQLEAHADLLKQIITQYCLRFPDSKKAFLKVLPDRVWNQVAPLAGLKGKAQKQKGFKRLEQYLNNKDFEIGRNLQTIRQIVADLEAGVDGAPADPRAATLIYLDLLMTLAVSVAREDPLMSYYPNAKELALRIAGHPSLSASTAFFQNLLDCFEIPRKISYSNAKEDCRSIMEMVLADTAFLKKLFQHSLDSEKTLELMLRVLLAVGPESPWCSRTTLSTIIFSLTNHRSEVIATLSRDILLAIPKKHQLSSLILKLFSQEAVTRVRVLSQLRMMAQPGADIVMLALERSTRKTQKKELKVSMDSIHNYFNIIFNPELEELVRCGAVDQLLGYVDRMAVSPTSPPACEDFYQFLISKLNETADRQSPSALEEKLIELFWVLSSKLSYPTAVFSLDLLVFLLCRVKADSTQAILLILMFQRVFQSPFTDEPLKNWAMSFYPHVELKPMGIEHPTVVRTETEEEEQTTNQMPEVKGGSWLGELIGIFIMGMEPETPILYKFEEEIAAAVADVDVQKLSKISFLLSRSRPQSLARLEGNSVNIVEHVLKKKQVSGQVEFDLLRILKSLIASNQKVSLNSIDHYESLTAPHLLLAISHCKGTVSSKIIEKLIKVSEEDYLLLPQVYICLMAKKIEWGKIDEYSALRLIEGIVKVVRYRTLDQELRVLAITLLIHLIQQEFPIRDHKSSLVGILRVMLQAGTPTHQFCLALECLNIVMPSLLRDELNFFKAIHGRISNLLSTLLSKTKGHTLLISSCLSFNCCLLRCLKTEEVSEGFEVIQSDLVSKDMATLACHFLASQGTIREENSFILVESGCQLLFLWGQGDERCWAFLLNSTSLLTNIVQIIQWISEKQLTSAHMGALEAIGRLMQCLSRLTDQFSFKLNALLKSDAFVLNYPSLFKALCSPLQSIISYLRSHPRGGNKVCYIRALLWVAHVWELDRADLEDEKVVGQLVECCVSSNCFGELAGLGCISKAGQGIIVNHPAFTHELKNWSKLMDEIIVTVTKQKKLVKKDRDNLLQRHIQPFNKIAHFLASLFAPLPSPLIETELPPTAKDNITLCIKIVDKMNSVGGLQEMPETTAGWQKLITNMFNSDLCARALNSSISEGGFSLVNQIMKKALVFSPTSSEEKESLMMLGRMSSNESVRSLILKHRLIEELNLHLIKMDENKVAKFNYAFIYAVASFFHFLSLYKDSNAKIITDKRVLGFWVKVVSMEQAETVDMKVLHLLTNLASYKHNKAAFMACNDIHKVCLGLLSDPVYQLKQEILSLLYNILYKNAAGARLYRRKEVLTLLEGNDDTLAEALLEILSAEDN